MNSSFEGNTSTGKDEWLTPPEIIKAIGDFDLDPCSPIVPPWRTATTMLNINDDGLSRKWDGLVWCNPPYGKEAELWLKKCSEHKRCIALIFARTETKSFFEHIWSKAKAVFFIKGRLCFYHVDGTKGGTAGAPSVLIAWDEETKEMLRDCKLEGKFLEINN